MNLKPISLNHAIDIIRISILYKENPDKYYFFFKDKNDIFSCLDTNNLNNECGIVDKYIEALPVVVIIVKVFYMATKY